MHENGLREQTPALMNAPPRFKACSNRLLSNCADISNELNPSIVESRIADRWTAWPAKSQDLQRSLRYSSIHRAHSTTIATTFYKITECAVDDALARPGCSMIEVKLKRLSSEFVWRFVQRADE